ncbi:M48 family metallopeptidase [Chitinophaga qingshengii]|uniref:M48 family metallopeptidase n=1 Tax=Chitinophaga qingshengii TaxID=1569794 RepID=A0ABR7TI25_9BACT|nr:M48 family metallopeptidase [Chitinophaga qingshengii]MBC9930155.1 M48 family metallopeptidase [Chitinophaga qingshengii]
MYPGKYFDNKTAALTTVDIQFYQEYLEFRMNRNGVRSRLSWLYKEINVQSVNGKQLRISTAAEGGLEIDDPECISAFSKLYYANRGYSVHEWLLRLGNKAVYTVALVLLLIVGLCYFVVLPILADQVAQTLPRSFDKKLGELAQSTLDETTDTAGSKLLTAFAGKINWETPDTLTFSVKSSKIDNAYALPGGYIVVYDALLKKIKTKEELAALLAHEVSHVKFRHSTRKLCKDMSTTLLLDLFLGGMGAYSGLYKNANTLHSLSYSRKYEKEADLEGLTLLKDNKIDQHGMLHLMETLSSIKQPVNMPTFLSSHPLTKNRIKYVDRQIKKHPAPAVQNEDLEKAFRKLKELYPS